MRTHCIFLTVTLFIASTVVASAQSLVNGFFSGKGRGAVAVSYSAEHYDEVFLVPSNAKGVPIFREVDVNSVSLFATYGLTDRLEATVSLPYITAKGQADPAVLEALGYENERKGLQDLSLALKYRLHRLSIGMGRLDVGGGLGLRTPVGSYRVDEGLQSILAIGNRATAVTAMALLHWQSMQGIFITAQGGYSLRSGEVPNAWIGEIKAGYAHRAFYVDVWYAGQRSVDGVNILGEGFIGFFPATDVTYTRGGVNAFVPVVSGIGISAGVNKYLSGRNVGASTGFYGGIVYSF